ncbi:hypothetical protein [Microbacterium telephonicum]|uniref:Uncharacterized protein n=1 Tax=Microbacterium telephonicum TaxID=1714841 RepID=A0A498CJA5_9MICO|nr:hypothetical protein [Microbacterium telephonicum]RLK52258.1 hypothetical protein C7474_0190 [Microbacterium telephonicum]
MQEFWNFAGNYWWLAFPLVAALGGVGRAWERGARARHKRRLEIIQAKTALRGAPTPVATASEPKAITKPSPTQPQLEKLFAEHDAVTKRWLEYELDVAKLIAYPTISDGRQPLTAAFLRAKKTADRLRPASAKAQVGNDDLAAYASAVTDFEVAFDVAEREARRLRDSDFTDTERKRLQTARQLLSVAVDEGATAAERQVAYKRVREELDGLIVVSDEAITILEERVALALTSPTPAAPTSPSPTPSPAPDAGADGTAPQRS